MLKERITICETGFQIRKENRDSGRLAFYTVFSLRDTAIDRSQAHPVTYWDAMNPSMQRVDTKSFVYVWEEKNGVEIDAYQFYVGTAGAKPRIQWSIERDRHYGENAYMIKLKWMDHIKERIHKRHIWLKDEQSGRKYGFLREYIEPDVNEEDRYIIDVLPGTADVSCLIIEGDELLHQKYLIVR
ncbi:MAG: hypothetical protein MRZ69_08305 [Lachnospiraceae bacterium]|nr:hypothetical protein [Lachnospiraceae bacterium]